MSEILDDTEKRCIEVKIKENEKQLIKATEAGNEDKIKLYNKNIEHYKKLLSKIVDGI